MVRHEVEDQLGKKCRCGKGWYAEENLFDDLDDTVTCSKCGHSVKRWKVIKVD